ncbi:MAG TPA: KEOPS complex subunit Cgi121 [Nitrososphaeraceae archaeon]|jgi:tRNA threonylcarbamoyladenosine modification (KEOPS) complex Cgi121 subunit|nr:KEOPS complex subunit Cgi121 [Nitrososphaeraceae archaeon]
MKEKILTISNFPLYKIDSIFVAIICTEVLGIADIGVTITTFRKMFPDVMIQGINPRYIFGKRHIFEVIKIILESNERKIKIAKRLEMELLLRLVCSNQVDKAIKIGGIKNNGFGCFVLLSQKKGTIIDSLKYLSKMFVKQNSSLLNATKEKMINMCERLEFPCGNFNKNEFLKILTEKAALVSL